MKERFQQLKEETPGRSAREMLTQTIQEFRELSDAEKKPYVDMAEEDAARYVREKEAMAA